MGAAQSAKVEASILSKVQKLKTNREGWQSVIEEFLTLVPATARRCAAETGACSRWCCSCAPRSCATRSPPSRRCSRRRGASSARAGCTACCPSSRSPASSTRRSRRAAPEVLPLRAARAARGGRAARLRRARGGAARARATRRGSSSRAASPRSPRSSASSRDAPTDRAAVAAEVAVLALRLLQSVLLYRASTTEYALTVGAVGLLVPEAPVLLRAAPAP